MAALQLPDLLVVIIAMIGFSWYPVLPKIRSATAHGDDRYPLDPFVVSGINSSSNSALCSLLYLTVTLLNEDQILGRKRSPTIGRIRVA